MMEIVEPLMNMRTSVSVPDSEHYEKGSQVCGIEPSWETRDSLIRQYQDYVELVTRQVRSPYDLPKERDAEMGDELHDICHPLFTL